MLQAILKSISPRSTVLSALATMLTLSLICSVSLQYGHADVPVATTAEDTQPLGVGDQAPRFEVRAVDGAPFVFDPRSLQRPAVLITFRGGWCPYCNMHLSELNQVIPEIAELGVDVYFLSGDRPDLLYKSLSRETQEDIAGLDYTILSDADAQAAVALGIAFKVAQRTIDRRYQKGDDIGESSMLRHEVLPVPSVFAIGQDGRIAFAYSNPDYEIRVPADELLGIAKDLVADE